MKDHQFKDKMGTIMAMLQSCETRLHNAMMERGMSREIKNDLSYKLVRVAALIGELPEDREK